MPYYSGILCGLYIGGLIGFLVGLTVGTQYILDDHDK